jgi:small multidrug resistance pump
MFAQEFANQIANQPRNTLGHGASTGWDGSDENAEPKRTVSYSVRRSESVTRALPYLYLALAIAFEVIGTSALKASETFTRLVPSLVTLVTYMVSFVFLALSLRTIPIGIAYALWAGLGIVLITLVGWFWFRQTLDVPALIGLALIVGGVVLVNAFSQSLPH